jgi:heme exporter protein D
MRCHRAEEGHAAGGETAPNLAGFAKRHPDRRYFLESMVLPSKFIAEGFGSASIDFKNGASLSGNLLAETPEHLDLDAAGKVFRIQRSDITSLTPPVSPMPPMAGLHSPSELRDMVAWLASLHQDSGPSKPPIQPMPLDPATLEVPEKTAAVVERASADPALLKLGKQQFIVCGACHGQSGEGTAAGPPLAGADCAGEGGMMPDLGKYADAVIWSYVSTIGLLVALVVVTLWQGRRVKQALQEVEARQERAGDA